ncbi:uncharacterized protein LOC123316359 [Coccinella septempunctata]|uniref:uncharacterized protein LOC123316359 n=1 Tax=Coccinella septempunctata TaxID=41139 RepID=UPI001D08D0F7|nr:uncharacterized protein LOC123316359 [Coccinella septempunctata]
MTNMDTSVVFQSVVERMMKSKDIENYKFEIDGGTAKSDGFIGDVIFFNIQHESEKEHLVLKTAKTGETIRKRIDADTAYDREICMYTKVLPALEQFTRRKGLSVIPSFIPKVLFNFKESLVMENLKMRGFHMWNKNKMMGMAHIKLLFENYGVWHGITMAFKDQQPDEFSSCVQGWIDSRFSLNKAFGLTTHFSREFSEVLKLLAEKGRHDLVDVYKKFEGRIDDYVYRRDLPERDMLIISHGDAWCNNFLFKYKDGEKQSQPNQVYFLDFQLSRPESPATEISSVLYNMGDRECFENFQNLLSVYHDKLSETLRSLGSDPDKLFPMDILKRHLGQYAFFSVLHSFIYTRVAQCQLDEAPDLGEMAENGKDLDGAFAFGLKNMELFWERILEVFIHYGEILKQCSNK